MIPERGMDARVFVISDMPAIIERLFGNQVVAFQGSSEWALDYLITTEAVWLPSETQLRENLVSRLSGESQPSLKLACSPAGCRCEMSYQGQMLVFEAADASDAYGDALLYLLTGGASFEHGTNGKM